MKERPSSERQMEREQDGSHKKQLENKTVEDISVFTEDDAVGEVSQSNSIKERTLFMMFRLG